MKKMKRLFAVLLTLAMVMGMSVMTFAETKKPEADDAAYVTTEGIEKGATFTAYQIIDAAYDDYGFTGYVWAAGIDEENIKANQKVEFEGDGENAVVKGLTSELITKLASDPTGLEKKENFNPTEDQLEAGTWMILVTPPTGNPGKIYNPMIVSVFYALTGSGSSNTLVSGTINAGQNWTLVTTNAFAKSSDIKVEKDLDNANTNTKVAVGDTVPFTITSEIPSYDPTYYTNPVFKITDTIVNGLIYKAEPKVYLGGTPAVSAQAPTGAKLLDKGVDYTLEYNENTGFTINFIFNPENNGNNNIKNLYSKSAAERVVTVKYETEVLDSAVTQVGVNEAKVDYSTKPGETQTAEKTDKEYVFSFALHNVFQKVDGSNKPLKDATFTLYKADANGKDTLQWAANEKALNVSEVTTYTTKDEENCDIKFKGLDGDLVYYVKETEAPTGYSINDTIYKVEFIFNKPENYEGGEITYKVKITDNKTNTPKEYTVSYGNKVTDEYGNAPKEGLAAATTVVNTKLSALPSTGGIGTTIFTIAGCLIMVAAAGLFFASRRKSAK